MKFIFVLLFLCPFSLFSQKFPLIELFESSWNSSTFENYMFNHNMFLHSKEIDSNSYFMKAKFGDWVVDYIPTHVVGDETEFTVMELAGSDQYGESVLMQKKINFLQLRSNYSMDYQIDLFKRGMLNQLDVYENKIYVPGLISYSKKIFEGVGFSGVNNSVSAMYFCTISRPLNGQSTYAKRELILDCPNYWFQSYVKEIQNLPIDYDVKYIETRKEGDKVTIAYKFTFPKSKREGKLILTQPQLPGEDGRVTIIRL